MEPTKIFIVEDEFIIAKGLARKLDKLGYQVVGIVSSGEEALIQIQKTTPDLVLMDVLIEGEMDGIETATQLLREFNIPVIYLTAYSDDKTLERAEQSGCYGYILKPFKQRELHATIRMALRKHQSGKASAMSNS
ncbi:MAG: response regulator [Cyanobacteria bacterium SW_9_44_58]|nr:MAG: response regulator [Cyanobacteria bacterium SW_9_44_58]